MELCKNIFFNTDKLIENQKIKVSYTGKFFTDTCKEVYIHYGFRTIMGKSWRNQNGKNRSWFSSRNHT